MKVLMLGWELPPLYAGGIGMVCYEIIKELSNKDIPIDYIMPLGPNEGVDSDYANVIIAENQLFKKKIKSNLIGVPALFSAYQSPEEYEEEYKKLNSKKKKKNKLYGKNLFIEVDLFAKRAYEMIDDLNFDIVHAHDWMTFPAAIGIADKTGKPLVVHVHNTIHDRYLGNASQHEKDIEYSGMKRADLVIAISNYVKNIIIKKYNIDPKKIRVVHNAKNTYMNSAKKTDGKLSINLKNKKIVLFTGRITIQKGPEYFLHAAKKVLEKRDDVIFIMAGYGDMEQRMIELAIKLGISKKVIFTGRYNMDQARVLYKAADCYVMPSVSEPFGIVPLEAMQYDTPCIISKQSGCSEVLHHTLKVDFWNTKEMAHKILSVLSYKTLNNQMKEKGRIEVENLTWDKAVDKLSDVYNEAIDMKK